MKNNKAVIIALLLTVGLFSELAYTIYFALYHPDILQMIGVGAGVVTIVIVIFNWIRNGVLTMNRDNEVDKIEV